jgi:hypothetical protein
VNVKASALLISALAIAFAYATLRGVQAFASVGLSDAFAMPGAVFGTTGGMAGLYDIPSRRWAVVCIIGNLLFYSALWWVVISLVVRLRRPRHEQGVRGRAVQHLVGADA